MHDAMGLAFAFGYAFFWAAASIALRQLSTRLAPFFVIGVRALIGTVVIIPMALIVAPEDFRLLNFSRLIPLVGSIVLGGVIGSTLSVYSMKLLGVARSFPISNASPLFTYLFSYLMLGERLRWVMIPGTFLVLAGVYLIARPSVPSPRDVPDSLPPRTRAIGVAMALGAAISWGVGSVILAPGLVGINTIVANTVRVSSVGIIATTIAGFRGELGAIRSLDRRTVLLFLLVGTLGHAGVSTMYVSAVKLIGPNLTAIIGTTAPMYALPLSLLLLREKPRPIVWVGTALTIAGILLVLQ